jgi:glycosyltransferase involved in cell wall biosynthesis
LNILVYYPYNLRTVEQQSVMEMFVKRGHKVVLLTSCERGELHSIVEKIGVRTESFSGTGGRWKRFRQKYKQLSQVIDKYHIDLVIAQQQDTALVAGILRKFKRFKLLYVRHNSDEAYQAHPFKAKWLNWFINKITPLKVAPSSTVENFWINHEGVSKKQVRRVNYGYNFSQYEEPVTAEVEKIRDQYPAKLLILSMARLVPAKRHREMFSVIKQLHNKGLDLKLICLGSGPLQEELEDLIATQGMQDYIFLAGRHKNIFDYIAAADVFLHLSLSEASNSAVKEAGLLGKTVIVCKGVGDFEDYIIHGQNGFLVNKTEAVSEATVILEKLYNNKELLQNCGTDLRDTVIKTFSIDRVAPVYDALVKETNE